MRKISFIMAALALVLGVTQCKKEDKPVASGETQHIVLTASNGNDGSKVNVALNEAATNLNLTWQKGDEITVSGAVEGTLKLTGGENTGTATFEGSVTRKEGETVTFSIGSAPESYEGQAGDVTWIQDHLYLVGTAPYNEEGVYGQDDKKVEMQLQYAVLKLNLSALGTADGNPVTITAEENPVASVAWVTDEVGKVYYVAMPAAESTIYTFSNNDKAGSVYWALAANTFYTGYNSTSAIEIKPVGGKIIDFSIKEGYETSDDLEFNFTIEPDDGCIIESAALCLSFSNPSPNNEDNDRYISCDFPYNTGSISKYDLINNFPPYESEQPIYIRLYVEFNDSNGYGPKVIDYSDVIEISFTF